MIKPKAPKDMMAEEFVNFAQERYESTPKNAGSDGMLSSVYMFELLREYLTLSAMNPFTPDQLSWMREEQKSGFEYAWCDKKGYVWCSAAQPSVGVIETGGWECAGCHGVGLGSFLQRILSADDPAPLCFADFAPLNNESTVS